MFDLPYRLSADRAAIEQSHQTDHDTRAYQGNYDAAEVDPRGARPVKEQVPAPSADNGAYDAKQHCAQESARLIPRARHNPLRQKTGDQTNDNPC